MTGLIGNSLIFLIVGIILDVRCKAELNKNDCPVDLQEELFLPHEYCNKFYQCSQGRLIIKECPENLAFNLESLICDWAYAVDCGDRKLENPDDENKDNEIDGNVLDDNKHSEAFATCAKNDSDGTLIVHEDCGKFYKCANGIPISFACYGALLFNPETKECDWPENVNCNNQDTEIEDSEIKDNSNENSDSENEDSDKNDSKDSDGYESDKLSEANLICAEENSDGVLVAHKNCQKFYKCANGVPVAFKCYGSLFYNPLTKECDWPQNVNCDNQNLDHDNKESREEDSRDRESGEKNCTEEEYNESAKEDSEQENSQENSKDEESLEDSGKEGSIEKEYETEESDDENNDSDDHYEEYDDDNGENNENNNPSGPHNVCAGHDSDGLLIPHKNCNKFYKCANGVPFIFKCSGSLLYNILTERCDWPKYVDCDDREILYDDNKLKEKTLGKVVVGLSFDL